MATTREGTAATAGRECDRLGVAIRMESDPADRRPERRARLLNVLLPGAGLIARDRLAMGMMTGLGFWIPLAVAFYGSWIAPSRIAAWQSFVLAAAALAAYLLGQVVLGRDLDGRAARLADYATRAVPMLRAVYAAMADAQWHQAQIELDAMLAFDPESFEANLAQARLLAIQAKTDQARRAYARCRRLDHARRWRWEIERESKILDAGG